MSIFLIRHGETALNAARVVQPADTPLSERGIAQAESVALRLAALGIACILSSDLPRALRTAEAIADRTGAPISVAPLLQERNFGALRGRAYDSLPGNPLTSAEAPPGGESSADFEARAADAWRLIEAADRTNAVIAAKAAKAAKARDAANAGRAGNAKTAGHLAVVTHGLMIRALLARVLAAELLPTHLGNTSLSVLDRVVAPAGVDLQGADARPRWVATLVNCTDHLQADRRDDPKALSGG